jgi:two-component system response regulator HydG
MSPPTVLLISDDVSVIESCQEVIHSLPDVRLAVVDTVSEADSYLFRKDLAVVLTHLARPEDGGQAIGLLRAITATRQPLPLVLLAEECSPEETLQLRRQGAADCLEWPLDRNRLAFLLHALTVRARTTTTPPPDRPVPSRNGSAPKPMAGTDVLGMDRLMEQVQVVAPQDTTLLLVGETGTGKTRLARLIHELSPRRKEPLLVVNCGALAANLIESEMFGHVKGAFTGAEGDRTGKFAEVGRGTLVLDEIDALPPPLQAKLLRAVEERLFEPVGSNKSQPVRARLIAASNRVLEKEVEAGRFRSDLYYRLNVVCFQLPPLRDRPRVIPELVAGFIAEIAGRNQRPVQGIATDALDTLLAYAWPGNIRELRNVIERAVALCPGAEIQLEDLPEMLLASLENGPAVAASGSVLEQAREEAEVARIMEALRKHGNNRLRAAAALGISRRTLYKKLHRYGLGVVKWAVDESTGSVRIA